MSRSSAAIRLARDSPGPCCPAAGAVNASVKRKHTNILATGLCSARTKPSDDVVDNVHRSPVCDRGLADADRPLTESSCGKSDVPSELIREVSWTFERAVLENVTS